MPINSSIGITGSVGKNGKNNAIDVATVQQRLNELMHPPRKPLVKDGICGSKTRAMIRDFQVSVCGFKWPDGRVDPIGKTILALNNPASEGIWGKMSIPPDPEPGSAGPGPATTPIDPVEAAIQHIAAGTTLSETEKKALRTLLDEIWKTKKGEYHIVGPGGISESDLNQWLGFAKNIFHVARISVVVASGSIAVLGSAAIVLSAVGVVVMTVGMVAALLRALTSDSRVYGAVGSAYYVVYWAAGGLKPLKSQRVINNYTSFKGKPPNLDDWQNAWQKGQAEARTALEKATREIAGKAGMNHRDAETALKAILRSRGKIALGQDLLQELSKGLHRSGDVQVANALNSLAKSLRYPE